MTPVRFGRSDLSRSPTALPVLPCLPPRIAGLEPCSLLDFPGHLAAVVFLAGCNLNCGYCHNRELIGGSTPFAPASGGRAAGDPALPLPLEALDRFLHSRRDFLDGIVVSGGEPIFSPGLPALLRQIRRHGYRIKLDTNGSRPEVLAALLHEGLVDFIALDIKAPLTDPLLYAEICGLPPPQGHALVANIRQSLAMIRHWANGADDREYECRTTCCPELGEADLEIIGLELAGIRNWAWQVWRDPLAKSGGAGSTKPVHARTVPLSQSVLNRMLPEATGRFEIKQITLRS